MKIYTEKQIKFFVKHLNIQNKENEILSEASFNKLKEIYEFLHLNKLNSYITFNEKEKIIIENTTHLLKALNPSILNFYNYKKNSSNNFYEKYTMILKITYKILSSKMNLFTSPKTTIHFEDNNRIINTSITKNSKTFNIYFYTQEFNESEKYIEEKISNYSYSINDKNSFLLVLKSSINEETINKIISNYKQYFL